jgi:hypothetical protein
MRTQSSAPGLLPRRVFIYEVYRELKQCRELKLRERQLNGYCQVDMIRWKEMMGRDDGLLQCEWSSRRSKGSGRSGCSLFGLCARWRGDGAEV